MSNMSPKLVYIIWLVYYFIKRYNNIKIYVNLIMYGVFEKLVILGAKRTL